MLEFEYYSGQTITAKFWTRADDTVQQGNVSGYLSTVSATVSNVYRVNPALAEVPAGDYYVTLEISSVQVGSFVAARVDANTWLVGDTFNSIDSCDAPTTTVTSTTVVDTTLKVWDEDLVLMLRAEIGDIDESTYSDNRLKQVLVYAAYSVYRSARFPNTYSISVANVTIIPDPVALNDYDFSILTVYRAACIILTGEAKEKGGKSVSIKDGPSFFDNRNAGTNTMNLMKIVCENYNTLLYNYQMVGSDHSDLAGLGQAILSPYSPGSFLMSWNRNEHRGGGRW